MSYRSRLYNHRNAQSQETTGKKPFFAKQHESNDTNKKNAFFQAKLSVNDPGDQYEHEADSVANAVVNNKTAKPVVKQKQISSVQRLATSMEDEKLGTNDARMERDKDDKVKSVQRAMADPEKEKEKPVQKMGEPEKEKDKKVQKKDEPKKEEEKKGLQRVTAAPEKEKEKPVQKMGEPEKEKDKKVQKKDEPKKEEEKKGAAAAVQKKPEGGGSKASQHVSNQIENSAGKGKSLPSKALKEMNSSFGADFRDVRVHHDNEAKDMSNELNAQAFTHGKDIYFNHGKFNPENPEGKHLLAHELTHVLQQQDEIKKTDMLQRSISESLPTGNGVFGVDMQTQALVNNTGLAGTIGFMPGQTAPYSNEISLIQIGRTTDPATGNVISGVADSGVSGGDALVTKSNPLTGVEGGFDTDVVHNQPGVQQDAPLSPNFNFRSLDFSGGPGTCFGKDPQKPGFKRSNDLSDIREAKIADCPSVPDNTSNVDFKFETVAKGTDSNVVYGSLHWGFKTRAGKVTDEQAFVVGNQSATFNEALARHQDFYTHEPLTFYFDLDHDDLDAGEQAKLDKEVTDYLNRFPDVGITISGFADKTGDISHNRDLAKSRAESVARLFTSSGAIAANKINPFKIIGGTNQFTADATTDQNKDANRRGNRRVTVEFEHTATVPLPGQKL